MGIRVINNKKPKDTNMSLNVPIPKDAPPEYQMPRSAFQSFEDRDGMLVAMKFFLKNKDKHTEEEKKVVPFVERVLVRLGVKNPNTL